MFDKLLNHLSSRMRLAAFVSTASLLAGYAAILKPK
jgi:hypothetical protein